MKSILILLCCFIIVIAINCSSSEPLNKYGKIELLKLDTSNISIKSQHPKTSNKYEFIDCIPDFPKTEIYITTFELLDSNKQIISAKPVGGENAITMRIVYPELAKRAEIEGNVWCEFKVDKDGNPNDIKILKDIGGGCGDQLLNAISKTKFYPGKLFNKNIDSRYKIAVQFKIIPISKKEEIK